MEKGKAKVAKSVLPKFLLGRDNTNMGTHGRRLCFNCQLGKCGETPDGGECSIPRKIMMEKRNDMAQVASARWLKLVWA